MTLIEAIPVAMALYLLLLGWSAWRQGELPQFLRSIAVVSTILLGVAAVVAAAITWDRFWTGW